MTQLRGEVVRQKRELAATSPQDQFAKWAKLQRQYEKTLAEHDKKSQSLQSFKSSFDKTVTVLRWLSTNGLRYFVQYWYAKQPMFWLHRGWVPAYVEWLLAFPRAPMGSISIYIWGIACATVVQIATEVFVAAWVLVTQKPVASTAQGKPMQMGAGSSREDQTSEKKEL